jgi:hypothetical protein
VLQRLIIRNKTYFFKLEFAAEEYAKRPIKKNSLVLPKSGGIDLDLIADDLLSKARELMSEAQSDPNHPIRNKFDVWMLDFAQHAAMK